MQESRLLLTRRCTMGGQRRLLYFCRVDQRGGARPSAAV